MTFGNPFIAIMHLQNANRLMNANNISGELKGNTKPIPTASNKKSKGEKD